MPSEEWLALLWIFRGLPFSWSSLWWGFHYDATLPEAFMTAEARVMTRCSRAAAGHLSAVQARVSVQRWQSARETQHRAHGLTAAGGGADPTAAHISPEMTGGAFWECHGMKSKVLWLSSDLHFPLKLLPHLPGTAGRAPYNTAAFPPLHGAREAAPVAAPPPILQPP